MARDGLRRRIAVVFSACLVGAGSLLSAPVSAADLPPDRALVVDPTVGPDGSRVVEREAVPVALPTEGGLPVGNALDPSVGRRDVAPPTDLPADRTPNEPTELTGRRTAHSRSTLNPDGSITAEYFADRLHYLDTMGDWQPPGEDLCDGPGGGVNNVNNGGKKGGHGGNGTGTGGKYNNSNSAKNKKSDKALTTQQGYNQTSLPDHEGDRPAGAPPTEFWVDPTAPDAPSEWTMRSEFTACATFADGNPASHLRCLQANLGETYGLYAFSLLGPTEYEARDTDWLIGPATVAVMIVGLAKGKPLPRGGYIAPPLVIDELPIVQSAQVKLDNLAAQFGARPQSLLPTILKNGIRYVEQRPGRNFGNINVLMPKPEGTGFLRVTLDPSGQRVISAGQIRGKDLLRYISEGDFVPLGGN